MQEDRKGVAELESFRNVTAIFPLCSKFKVPVNAVIVNVDFKLPITRLNRALELNRAKFGVVMERSNGSSGT